MLTKIVMGEEVILSDEEEAAVRAEWAKNEAIEDSLEYISLRIAAYPSLPDQLDMIYKDKINGTNIWETTISSIKAEYPKPVSK